MTAPGDFPAPDLKDSRGRMRRLVISLLLGVGAASIVYGLAYSLAKPDENVAAHSTYHVSRAWQFVFYFAGLAFIAVFLVAMAVQKKLADKKYVESLSPQARVVR